jgi:hypothetical protein
MKKFPMPLTINGCQFLEILSALQKHLRRGNSEESFLCCAEIVHSHNKAYLSALCNRLRVVAIEDCDVALSPWLPGLVQVLTDQAEEMYPAVMSDPRKLGRVRMPLAAICRAIAAAPKSRVVDNMQAALGLANLIEGRKPDLDIGGAGRDMHTAAGRRAGKGLDDFRQTEENALYPAPVEVDPYLDAAYRLRKKLLEGQAPGDKPDDPDEDDAQLTFLVLKRD